MIYGKIIIAWGLATIYYPDPSSPYVGPVLADGSKFVATTNHIAHRTIPLGTRGTLCVRRDKGRRIYRCIKTVVRDRGPYGVIRLCPQKPLTEAIRSLYTKKIRWRGRCYLWRVTTRRLLPGEVYRETFDLSKPAARALGVRRAWRSMVFISERK